MAGFNAVIYFLTGLLFSLILLVLWIRVALRYFRISPLHPVGQMIYKLTNPVLQPFEKILFSPSSPRLRYDIVALVLILMVSLIKFLTLGLLGYGIVLPIGYLLLFSLADLIIQPCNLLFYALLIRVIMSWVNPQWQNPINDLIRITTNPLIRLGHKIIPDISGFDFSPFLMMIILKIITLFISASMPLPLM